MPFQGFLTLTPACDRSRASCSGNFVVPYAGTNTEQMNCGRHLGTFTVSGVVALAASQRRALKSSRYPIEQEGLGLHFPLLLEAQYNYC